MMVLTVQEPPRRDNLKAWAKLKVYNSDLRSPTPAEVDPDERPAPERHPGKKKGAWMTLREVDALVKAEGLEIVTSRGQLSAFFSATTLRRTRDGIDLYHRPAVERMMHQLKLTFVRAALGGRR